MVDTRTAPYAALLLRVSLGAMLVAHGLLLKVMTFGVAGTVAYFEKLGFPGFFAYLVILGEIGGGLALILGFYTRVIAVLLIPILVGATLQHVGNGWIFTAKGGGWEYPAFWTVTLAVQALLGDGAFAWRPALATAVPASRAAEAH